MSYIKEKLPTGIISSPGSGGTAPIMPVFTGAYTIGNSSVTDNTTYIDVSGYIECGGSQTGLSTISAGLVVNEDGDDTSIGNFRVETEGVEDAFQITSVTNKAEFNVNLYLESTPAGTDNTVLCLDSNNRIIQDEINSKVWDSGLVDTAGSTANYLAYFSSSHTITGSSALQYDGDSLIIANPSPLKLTGIGAGVDNTVLVLDSSGYVKTDEIDDKVWKGSLVEGTGVSGAVTFWDGTASISHDDRSFFWDDTNKRLGIRTATPSVALDVTAGGFSLVSGDMTLDVQDDDHLVWSGTTSGATIDVHNTGGAGGAGFSFIDDASSSDWTFKAMGTGGFKIRDGTNSTDVVQIENGADANSLYIDSAGLLGLGTDSPTERLDVNSDAIRVRTSQTPASASATGTQGTICWDSSYIYICVATDTWKRAALSTW